MMDFYEVINKQRTMRDWHFIVMKDKQVVLKLIENSNENIR